MIFYKQVTHINQKEELNSRIVNATKRKTTMLIKFKFPRTFIGNSRGSNSINSLILTKTIKNVKL